MPNEKEISKKKPSEELKTIAQWKTELTGKTADQIYTTVPMIEETGSVEIDLETLNKLGLVVVADGTLEDVEEISMWADTSIGGTSAIAVPTGETWEVLRIQAQFLALSTVTTASRTCTIRIPEIGNELAIAGASPTTLINFPTVTLPTSEYAYLIIGQHDVAYVNNNATVSSTATGTYPMPFYLTAGADISAVFITSQLATDKTGISVLYRRVRR